MKKSFEASLKQRKLTIGSWITLADTSVAELMARQGFAWMAIDMEHSVIGLSEAQDLIRVIEANGVVPLVRVGENNPVNIKRVMDAGAYGVIVPMVNSASDAKGAVNAVKYPPLGTRGVGLARAQGYGLEFEQYKNWVNRQSIVVVQIEHIDAVGNLEEILSVKGVDASIIGPYDLSASLGCPGEFEKKEVKEAIARYIAICRKLRKPAGFHVIDPDARLVNNRIREGFTFIGFSLDTLFLGKKVADELGGIKHK